MSQGLTVTTFPSVADYQKLKEKISTDKWQSLSEDEKKKNYLYNVAWHNTQFGSFHFKKDGKWFTHGKPNSEDKFYDPGLVSAAEFMFRRWKNIAHPDLPEPKRHSDEEIAHVAACARLARLYLDHGERRRQAAVRDRPVPPPLPEIRTDRMTAAKIEAEIEALIVAAGLRG